MAGRREVPVTAEYITNCYLDVKAHKSVLREDRARQLGFKDWGTLKRAYRVAVTRPQNRRLWATTAATAGATVIAGVTVSAWDSHRNRAPEISLDHPAGTNIPPPPNAWKRTTPPYEPTGSRKGVRTLTHEKAARAKADVEFARAGNKWRKARRS